MKNTMMFAGQSWGPIARVWLFAGVLAATLANGCESSEKPDANDDEARRGASSSEHGDGVESIAGSKRALRDGGASLQDGGDVDAQASTHGGSPIDRDEAGERTPDEPASDGGEAAVTSPIDAGSEATPVQAPSELALPDDPGVPGPWPVGVRTVMVTLASGQAMPVEVWYPAVPGSESGKAKVVYDLAQWLPPEAIKQMPASALPVPSECNCYRDLPLDQAHGPYPAAILVHNVGAFRVGSAGILAHWASRGFIALAADHPSETLADWCDDNSRGRCSGSGIAGDSQHTRDVPKMLAALRSPQGELAFLAGSVDATRVAVSGHSEGAAYAAAVSGEPGVRLVMIWNASTSVTKRGDLRAVLYLASKQDTLLGSDAASIENTYANAASRISPAFFVSVNYTGHLSVTSFCTSKNKAGQTGMDMGTAYDLCGIDWTPLRLVWDCSSTYLPQQQADLVFGYATSAALEQVLLGKNRDQAWSKFKSEWGEVKQAQ